MWVKIFNNLHPNKVRVLPVSSSLRFGMFELGADTTPIYEIQPDDETEVWIFVNGKIRKGVRVWERAGWEELYASFLYWDSPTKPGQEWDHWDVTHWWAGTGKPTKHPEKSPNIFTWFNKPYGDGWCGYECSSKGDKRFSAFYARMPDGRTIEQHYQCDVKGFDPGGAGCALNKIEFLRRVWNKNHA